MRIYLAGPMRNLPEFNHPAFRTGTALLRAAGHQVFSPAEHDNHSGYDFTGTDGSEAALAAHGFNLRVALANDLAWICEQADGVVVLPGWEASLGVNAEVATALALGLPVWPLSEFLTYGTDAPRLTREGVR